MGSYLLLADRWRDLALDLCDAIGDAFDEQATPDRRPPVELRHGTSTSHDQADVVYVMFERVRAVTERKIPCPLYPQGRFRVDLLRPFPSDPRLDADMAYAHGLLEDGSIVWDGLVRRWQAGSLFRSAPEITTQDIEVGDLAPIEVSGALAGWRLAVDVDLIFPVPLPTT